MVVKKARTGFSQYARAQGDLRYTPPNFAFQPVQTQLLAKLAEEASTWPKVMSIVAPMGYGKTVLMSELYHQLHLRGESTVWIGLDERDADLVRLLDAIEGTLKPGFKAATPPQVLVPGYPQIESRIDALLSTLSNAPRETTIFIDNLNSCSDPALGALLDALIFRAPAHVRFVWSSSTKLPFNFARAKLQGLIRQIGFPELIWSDKDTGEILGAELESRIGTRGIEALLQQTEGWPAALRLAQIILADASEPLAALEDFSGADEDIAALLNRHVFETFSADLQEFVLKLAALRTFSSELARDATGDAEAARHIDFLVQRNIFIVPLDRHRNWYRLHGLFRSYLQSEALQRSGTIETESVLERAARWCEKSGEWRDAVDYALTSGAGEIASRILEKTATAFVRDQGDILQYVRWIAALEARGVAVGWEASYWHVWALIFSRNYDYGRQHHTRLCQRMEREAASNAPPPEDLPQRMDHLRICLSLFTDQLADARLRADHWLAHEKTGDPFNVGSISCMKSICLISNFKFADAQRTMQIAEPILRQVGSAYSSGWASLINATLASYRGDYLGAYEILGPGLAQARKSLGDEAGICGTMALVAAQCLVEMGVDDQAMELVQMGLRTAHSHGLVDTMASGFDAALKLWDGTDASPISLTQLKEIASSYPSRLALTYSCLLGRRLAALGRVQEMESELSRMQGLEQDATALSIARYNDLLSATLIDAHVASGNVKKAKSLIGPATAAAKAAGLIGRLVELRLADAAIEMRLDKPAQAQKLVSTAISQAARGRIVRPFLDHAAMLAELINTCRPASWSFPIGDETNFFTELSRHPAIATRLATGRDTSRSFDHMSVDMPTRREIEILTLMDRGLSNQQLADHENVSITTVKWHLQNMYRKLGVTNRAAALARARTLNLLPK